MKYLGNMRYAYNRRLRSNWGVQGKITIKFAIDQYGRIIFSKVIATTANDNLLEQAVREQIACWKFGPIMKEGDVTEVIYPFVFSR
jgi:TonB family protein